MAVTRPFLGKASTYRSVRISGAGSLRDRAKNDVDALIKVNKELAQVQSELESVTGNHAHLMRRVETEILNVSIRSVQYRSFWRPITLAITDFGSNFSQGISVAITGIAYLTPWVLFVMFVVWVGRRLWRRWKESESKCQPIIPPDLNLER